MSQKNDFCGETVEGRGKSPNSSKNLRKTKLPKKSVKVPKAVFDKVLGKLIKAKPQKRRGN